MSNLGKNVKDAKIYTKISNLEPPFWGITQNRLKQLKDEKDFYVRFDYPKGSIVLTSDQIEELIKDKNVAQDGDYKIVLKDLKEILNKSL